MTEVITLHSIRGGVGKTLIAINLAVAYANLGRDVCLVDLDFRAPSLFAALHLQHPRLWMNDFLDGRGKIWDVFVDVRQKYDTDGRLLVGLADPSLESIRNMAWKDKRWEMEALKKLISMKRELVGEDVEYVIFDTGPGMLIPSVNAVACSDVVVIVTTADAQDVEETRRAVAELYRAFEKSTYVFMNKVMPGVKWRETEREAVLERFAPMFNAPIVAIVPCYCDLLNSGKTSIYTLEMPEHPFSEAIYDTANRLSAKKRLV